MDTRELLDNFGIETIYQLRHIGPGNGEREDGAAPDHVGLAKQANSFPQNAPRVLQVTCEGNRLLRNMLAHTRVSRQTYLA